MQTRLQWVQCALSHCPVVRFLTSHRTASAGDLGENLHHDSVEVRPLNQGEKRLNAVSPVWHLSHPAQLPVMSWWHSNRRCPSEPLSQWAAPTLLRRNLCQAECWHAPEWHSLHGMCPCGSSELKWVNSFSFPVWLQNCSKQLHSWVTASSKSG